MLGDDYQFDITANNVRMVNLELRNGEGIDCNSYDGCSPRSCAGPERAEPPDFDSGGDRAKVLRSSLLNCGSTSVSISGDDAVVSATRAPRGQRMHLHLRRRHRDKRQIAGLRGRRDLPFRPSSAGSRKNSVTSADGSIVEMSGDGARFSATGGNVTTSAGSATPEAATTSDRSLQVPASNRGSTYDYCFDISARTRRSPQLYIISHDFGSPGTDELRLRTELLNVCGDMEVSGQPDQHHHRGRLRGSIFGLLEPARCWSHATVIKNASDYGMYVFGHG